MDDAIFVPVDGSSYSLRALDVAAGLASSLRAKVVFCNVVDTSRAATMTFGEAQLLPGCMDILRAEGDAILKDAANRVSGRVPDVRSQVGEGKVVDEILRLATECAAKWIVVGSHGRTGIHRLLMGSVAEAVLRHASVPVMVVPPDHHDRQAVGKSGGAASVPA
jgi:nucleotide-binding universal stress UspA family protein